MIGLDQILIFYVNLKTDTTEPIIHNWFLIVPQYLTIIFRTYKDYVVVFYRCNDKYHNHINITYISWYLLGANYYIHPLIYFE